MIFPAAPLVLNKIVIYVTSFTLVLPQSLTINPVNTMLYPFSAIVAGGIGSPDRRCQNNFTTEFHVK